MRKHPKHRNHINPNYNIRPLSPAAVERLLYGEPLPDKHSRERLQEARKEHPMPDMRTALESALKNAPQITHSEDLTNTINEWAKDDQPLNQTQTNLKEKTMPNPNPTVNYAKQPNGLVRFTETVGVARAVFDYVQKHGGMTREQITAALVPPGFKKNSVQSLVGQNLRAGYFRKDSKGGVYPIISEYKPVPASRTMRLIEARIKAKAPKAAKTITLVPPKVTTRTTNPAAPKTTGIAALKVDTGVLGVNVFDPKALLDTLSVMQASALYQELKKIFGG